MRHNTSAVAEGHYPALSVRRAGQSSGRSKETVLRGMAGHRAAGTKVTAYATGMTLTGVQLVGPGTLGRVRQNGYREVCADAKGRVEAVDSSADLTGLRRATFRPHQMDTPSPPATTASRCTAHRSSCSHRRQHE